ncbi:hypothetical protein ZHAS_00013045 [Anopheles sinensis]|uniref:Uncharacterized protein n=1 Tax=Anopheles sinensis TaxID=74873 RepID=A0A084W4H9_ANOSI|nr:hypothetical protein ZHAS_00013045 [Anopheles sinensis]
MASTDPFQMEMKQLDGRLVIEGIGRQVAISSILMAFERNPEMLRAEELRVIATDSITIDARLKNAHWHGKNIVMLTDAIKVTKPVTWDVSGKNNDHVYPENAGTDKDGDGVPGKDGYPGESGGNVLILANSFEGASNLTIVSNGGDGSNGQNGGRGRDGENGTGIHLKAVTREGNEITFSYECGSELAVNCQSFLLFKGSPGKGGGNGGQRGLGGQGGYAGEVMVANYKEGKKFEIKKTTQQGKDGKSGSGGLYGSHGKNGWDMGYTDYSVSNFFTESWPKYFGLDGNGKLAVEYHSENSSSRVYCPYKQMYATIKRSEIDVRRQAQFTEFRNKRDKSDRKHYAFATRKKPILESTVRQTYSEYLNLLPQAQSGTKDPTKRVQLEKSYIKSNFKCFVQSDIKKSTGTQAQKQAFESRTKRHVQFLPETNYYSRKGCATKMHSKDRGVIDASGIINSLTIDPNAAPDALLARALKVGTVLQTISISAIDFQPLFCILENVKQSVKKELKSEDRTLRLLEELMIKKYKIAIMEEVAKQLPSYEKFNPNVLRLLTAEEAARYLTVDSAGEKQISHPLLGRLSQYLFVNSHQQRNRMSAYFREELPNYHPVLGRALELYVLEAGIFSNTNNGL